MGDTSRRQYLRRSAALALTAAAGCLDSETPDTDTSPPEGNVGAGDLSPTPATGPQPTDPPTGTTADTDTATSAATEDSETGPTLPPGPVAWLSTYEAALTATPVVSDDRVYVGSEDGTARRHGTDSGAVEWTFDAGVPVQDLTVGEETVLVVSGTTELSADQTLHALDATTGTERWTFSDHGDDRYGVLVGLDADTGEERWRFEEGSVTSTVTRDGTLYVGGSGVAALDPGDGTPLWRTDRSGFVTEAGVTRDRVYAGGDGLQAYGRDGGKRHWEWTPDPAQGGVFVAGIAGSRLLLDAYHDEEPRHQYKFAVDAGDGTQEWAFEDGTGLTDLVAGTEVAVVGGENGRVYGLDPTGG